MYVCMYVCMYVYVYVKEPSMLRKSMTYSAFEVDLYYTSRTLDAKHDIVNQQLCTSHAFAHIYVNAYPHPFFDQL